MKQKDIPITKNSISLNLSSTQEEQINFLKNLFKKHTNKVYIVGGTIRNHFLKIKNKNDIDIEVHNISIELFDSLMLKIGASGVGKSFFVYKYKDIDISLPRSESKVSYGHNGFDVVLAKDEYTASLRRDFTMNALMFNIYTNEVLDYHDGIINIDNKLIKIVNKDTFIEDSLRVLRAIRFSCTYDLKIEDISLKLMSNMSIKDLSDSRIYNEIKQILSSKYLRKGLFYLIKTNVFFQIFDKKINKKEFFFIIRYIKNNEIHFIDKQRDYYLLFIIMKYLNVDIDKLSLSNRYKFIKKEIYISKNITNKNLMILALIKPINEYLDATNFDVINKAKYLKIYENKLSLEIDVQKIIELGFKGKQIGLQIKKQEDSLINKILINFNQF